MQVASLAMFSATFWTIFKHCEKLEKSQVVIFLRKLCQPQGDQDDSFIKLSKKFANRSNNFFSSHHFPTSSTQVFAHQVGKTLTTLLSDSQKKEEGKCNFNGLFSSKNDKSIQFYLRHTFLTMKALFPLSLDGFILVQYEKVPGMLFLVLTDV